MARKLDAFSGVSMGLLMLITFAGCPWIRPVENARILAVEPIAAKSHWNFISSVVRSLTDAGHHVTMYTPLPDGDRENYTEVDMSGEFLTMMESDAMEFMDLFSGWFKPMIIGPLYIRDSCKRLYRNDGIVALMEGKTKADFDVMIVEPAWTDCTQLLASKLNVPTIFAIPSPLMPFTEHTFTGNMPNPAFVSNMMAHHAIPKTFVQRLENTVLSAYGIFIVQTFDWILSITDPHPYDLVPVVSPSIIFHNSHYATEASRPIAPNLIEVGGIHLKPPKSLPKDILDFLDDAPNGAIYFTFGSMIKVSTLPEHILKTLVNVLGQVPQKVLWKFDGKLKNKPKNVMTRKWFPQREILLHPNLKLFISHGGISGMYEAVDASVPVLGFPLLFDQPRNIDHLVHYKMAISLDLFAITEDTLLNSISELINNEQYMKNAKITSEQFKDRPMTPQQSVVYWVEYVIRHKGAPHLKSHGLNLTWYQYFLLDVIAVVLICILLVLFIVYKVFKCICGCTVKSSQNVKVKSH